MFAEWVSVFSWQITNEPLEGVTKIITGKLYSVYFPIYVMLAEVFFQK